MSRALVVFYQDRDGSAPAYEALRALRRSGQHKALAKSYARVARLGELGHELRRPEADLLRDGIFELRIRFGTVNYRILYFFHGRDLAVLSHMTTKEARVPETEIERALLHRSRFIRDPEKHTFRM
jgi:phage-related protein